MILNITQIPSHKQNLIVPELIISILRANFMSKIKNEYLFIKLTPIHQETTGY